MASLLTLAYFLTMQRKVFFGPLEADYLNLKEANFWCLFPAIMLAAITLALGVAGPWLFETFLMPVGSPL
jgi:multicomponent Na+:H+ antiporter subunit D